MGARCRLCAECSEDLVPVLDDVNLSAKILQLFQIKIVIEDCLPTSICHICYETVNKVWEFNERVQRAQVLLSEVNVITLDTQQSHFVQSKEMVECVLSDSCAPAEDSVQVTSHRRPKSSRIRVCNLIYQCVIK